MDVAGLEEALQGNLQGKLHPNMQEIYGHLRVIMEGIRSGSLDSYIVQAELELATLHETILSAFTVRQHVHTQAVLIAFVLSKQHSEAAHILSRLVKRSPVFRIH
jgi:hypothetical protein